MVARVRVAYATACLVVVGTALAVVVTATQGCYSTFEPACGFVCGAQGACPDDYTCHADGICHQNNSPPDLVCYYDAATMEGLRADAPEDTVKSIDADKHDARQDDARPIDADKHDAEKQDAEKLDAKPIDAKPIDAEPIDAKPIDAEPIDAKPDAPIDAKPDAPTDAPPD